MTSKTNRIIGGIIIAVGALILLDELFGGFDFWNFIWKLWPLLLIILGIYIIRNRNRMGGGNEAGETSSENTIFGDLDIYLRGEESGGRRYTTLIGDIRMNLTEAGFKTGENNISVFSLIGDVRLKIPDNIPVRLHSRSFIGDMRIDDQRRDGFFQKLDHIDENYGTSDKKLSLSVDCIIGDLEVTRIKINGNN